MGTTMAFYYVKNRGFDREWLQNIMEKVSQERDRMSGVDELFEIAMARLDEATREQVRLAMEASEQRIKEDRERYGEQYGFMMVDRPQLPSPMVAYRYDAPWLPFFDVDICEGWTASSEDARRLSEKFWAPVLACSIADSDIMFVSYCDVTKNIAYDYAKPNFEEMEEMGDYDIMRYRTEFPQFLVDLCPNASEEKLREIWDADEVFADDRMYKLGEILGLSPINGKVPDGFEVITES